MIGRVARLEMILGSRRGRFAHLRRLCAGWLLLQFGVFYLGYLQDIWASMMPPPNGPGLFDLGAANRFTVSYLRTLVGQQFLLLVLLTPAFVAGAITDEKSRGTLLELLTTGLSSAEIVIGKLLGRLAQLGLLSLTALPFLCLVAPFGEFDALSILALIGFLALTTFAVGAASMLASVWCWQTRHAVLSVYGIGGGALLVAWGLPELAAWLGVAAPAWLATIADGLSDGLPYLDPRFVLEPAWAAEPALDVLRERLLGALLLWGSIGSVCLALAVWRLRRAYVLQLEKTGHKERLFVGRQPRLADADEPVRWKEDQVEGIAPLPMLRRIPRWLAVLGVFLVTTLISLSYLQPSRLSAAQLNALVYDGHYFKLWGAMRHPLTDMAFLKQALLVLVAAMLAVGVRCSGAVTSEREGQTWEALLLTPLPVRELIRGKRQGILDALRPYLLAYALPALSVSFFAGPIAFMVTLVVLVFLLPALAYMGALGVYFSVTCSTSWKSLLSTLASGYLSVFALAITSAPVIGFVSMIFVVLFSVLPGEIGHTLLLATMSGMVLVVWFWVLLKFANSFLLKAQNWVVGRERTPFWKHGVNCSLAVEQYLSQYENRHA